MSRDFRPIRPIAGTLAYVPLLLVSVWAAWFFVQFLPGSMSPDSFDQYEQAVTGVFNDHHPPIMALALRPLLLRAFAYEGAGMAVERLLAEKEHREAALRALVVIGDARAREAFRAALDALHGRLRQTPGVEIEFAPEALNNGRPQHMMCSIPGGIRVEFIAPEG